MARGNSELMDRQRRALLVWWYTRNDLTQPVVDVLEGYQLSVLFFPTKAQEGRFENRHQFQCLYWLDYSSPQAILEEANPELIVFMGIDSTKAVALRMAAAHRSVPCYVVEHGIKNDLEWIDRDFNASAGRKGFFAKRFFFKGADVFATLRFAANVLSFKRAAAGWKLATYMLAMMRWPTEVALQKVKFAERLADAYFVFAPFQERWYMERDNIPSQRLHSIGSIFFDDFFHQYHSVASADRLIAGRYALVIDQPLEEMSLQDHFDLYKALQKKLAAAGLQMVVKLHPDDYNRPEVNALIATITQITWVKQTDIVNLVYNADACFGFYSTLLIPIVCLKPCYIFDFFNVPIVQEWKQLNAVSVISSPALSDWEFKPAVMVFNNEAYIREYLFSTDGRSRERLREYLLTQ